MCLGNRWSADISHFPSLSRSFIYWLAKESIFWLPWTHFRWFGIPPSSLSHTSTLLFQLLHRFVLIGCTMQGFPELHQIPNQTGSWHVFPSKNSSQTQKNMRNHDWLQNCWITDTLLACRSKLHSKHHKLLDRLLRICYFNHNNEINASLWNHQHTGLLRLRFGTLLICKDQLHRDTTKNIQIIEASKVFLPKLQQTGESLH